MNGKVETGRVMNALGHISIGLGSKVGKEGLLLSDYVDADGIVHPDISDMPFIVLKAKNSNKIEALKKEAELRGVVCVDFIDTMTGGTYQEQLENTKQTKGEELTYFGIVLFGDVDIVSELTRKFSLWK